MKQTLTKPNDYLRALTTEANLNNSLDKPTPVKKEKASVTLVRLKTTSDKMKFRKKNHQ